MIFLWEHQISLILRLNNRVKEKQKEVQMIHNKVDTLTYQEPFSQPGQSSNDDVASTAPIIPSIEFLGRGYNIISFDPLNPGAPGGISQISLFDLNINSPTQDGKFLIPKGSIYTPDPRLSFQAQSTQLETAFDLNQKFSASVKASGGYGPLSFSASGSYEDFSKHTESTSSIVMFASFDVQVWVLSWQQTKLSQAFQEAVSQLPITYDESAYFKFIDTFGTHYPERIVYGGLGYQSYTFTRESRAQLEGDKVNISVAAEVGLAISAGVGGETSRERQEFQSLSNASSASSLLYVGGTNQSSYETFVGSIAQNPIPVQLKLEELTELLTEENFPNLSISTLKNNLIQANEAYALQNGSGYVRYASSSEDSTNVYSISGTDNNEPFLSFIPGSIGVYLVDSSHVNKMVRSWHIISDQKNGGELVKTGDVINITLDVLKTGAFTFLGARPSSRFSTYDAVGVAHNDRTRYWKIIDPLDLSNVGELVFIGKEYVLYNEALNKTLGFYTMYPSSSLPVPPVVDTVTDVRARCKFI
jgi:hypothetical protein